MEDEAMIKKITKIWFDNEHIFGCDEDGKVYSQSLLWYPKLRAASDEERLQYTFGFDGIHWRNLDEDIVLRVLPMKMQSQPHCSVSS